MPQAGIDLFWQVLFFICLVIKCKNELFMCNSKIPNLPPVPCFGLEVIIWEGLFYHIKCKIVYLSVLWFFKMGRMASEQMIGLWGESCSFRSALPRSTMFQAFCSPNKPEYRKANRFLGPHLGSTNVEEKVSKSCYFSIIPSIAAKLKSEVTFWL